MPYTTLVTGTTITSAWANASVRDQGVSPFTDTTARAAAIATPVTGMVSILTSGLLRLDVYNGASYSSLVNPAWGTLPTWAPSVVQSGAVTVTTNYAVYMRIGRLVVCFFDLTVTGGSAVANNLITMTTPFTMRTGGVVRATLGYGQVRDVSGTTTVSGGIEQNSSTTVKFRDTNGIGEFYAGQSGSLTAALANTDQITGVMAIEANTDA